MIRLLAAVAILWAAPSFAQVENAPPALSLVVARATGSFQSPFEDPGCGALCFNPLHYTSFDGARTLYGPPLPAAFQATMRMHMRMGRFQRIPMLLVVAHWSDGNFHIVGSGIGSAEQPACIEARLPASLDWHPSGPEIIERAASLCASVAAQAAIPNEALLETPVVTVSADEIVRAPPSLIVGRWQRERFVGSVPCPEDGICTNVIVEARIVDVETLSGPGAPRSLSARLEIHVPPADGYDLMMVVWPRRNRIWEGRWVRPVQSGRDTCVETALLAGLGVHPPARSYARGEDTCFPV